jgi:polar amino acid transport system substrate-binding protein
MKFSSIISSLKTDRIDFAISALNATPERRQNVDFSIDYYSPEYAMVYRKDSPIKLTKDCHNKIIGAQIGSTMEGMLKNELKAGKSFKLIALEKNTVMIEEVKVHRIDAVLVELAQAKAFTARYPDILAYSPFGSKGQGYAIAFKKGSPLRKEFNRAIIALQKSGELRALERKWGI